jgi:NAD(P)-dependent dehydrogenase (short-subunit alcohol dehydrogenase family)
MGSYEMLELNKERDKCKQSSTLPHTFLASSYPIMSKTLAGRIAIVTGGSRGIGAGIALELAIRGANILITYNAAFALATATIAQLHAQGVEAIAVQASGSDRTALQRIVAAARQKWGRIDIIINNAAAGDACLLENLTPEIWEKIHDSNLRFPTFLVQAALPLLGASPRIVNISSVMARMGGQYSSAYCASKAGLEGITKVWAAELGHKYGATVNCVNVGPTATDMWNSYEDLAAVAEWTIRVKQTPAAPRIATVDDIAQIVGFLTEERSRWTTGSTVNANGGMCFV